MLCLAFEFWLAEWIEKRKKVNHYCSDSSNCSALDILLIVCIYLYTVFRAWKAFVFIVLGTVLTYNKKKAGFENFRVYSEACCG